MPFLYKQKEQHYILLVVFFVNILQGINNTTPKCVYNCEGPVNPDGNINPTPPTTYESSPLNTTEIDEYLDADRQFWLLTVLKSDGKDPIIVDLKNSLAKLYRIAFQRYSVYE